MEENTPQPRSGNVDLEKRNVLVSNILEYCIIFFCLFHLLYKSNNKPLAKIYANTPPILKYYKGRNISHVLCFNFIIILNLFS